MKFNARTFVKSTKTNVFFARHVRDNCLFIKSRRRREKFYGFTFLERPSVTFYPYQLFSFPKMWTFFLKTGVTRHPRHPPSLRP